MPYQSKVPRVTLSNPSDGQESPWMVKNPMVTGDPTLPVLGEVASSSSRGADHDEMREFPNSHVAGR